MCAIITTTTTSPAKAAKVAKATKATKATKSVKGGLVVVAGAAPRRAYRAFCAS
jgi:hypothetical protein